MTRLEAISILHGIRADNLNLDDLYTKDKYDALGMTIKISLISGMSSPESRQDEKLKMWEENDERNVSVLSQDS